MFILKLQSWSSKYQNNLYIASETIIFMQNFFQVEFLNWNIHDSKTSKIFWLHYIKVQILSENHKIWKKQEKNPPFFEIT